MDEIMEAVDDRKVAYTLECYAAKTERVTPNGADVHARNAIASSMKRHSSLYDEEVTFAELKKENPIDYEVYIRMISELVNDYHVQF